MQLELIPEEEMAGKPKKVSETKPKDTGIKIIRESKDEKEKDVGVPTPPAPPSKGGGGGPSPNIIVKRIYFPGDIYSNNQIEFKKILARYGLSWYRPMMKSYVSASGVTLLSGMYVSADQNKKMFCIYEGTNKPMTAVLKIIGSGGNFLIDLNSYCHRVGCIVEDKDEAYVNNMLLSLQEKGEIYIEKKIDSATLEDLQKSFNEKVEKRLKEEIEKWINAHKFIYDTYCECLLWGKGISMDNIRKLRGMEIEKHVRWAVEKGY